MQDNSFYSKYKYIRTLGHGGCGEVFLAQNITLGNLWAVKEIVKGENASISGYIEPEILKRLNHPALPRICDVYEDETKFYIVEDYLEGICLKQELDTKGKFDEQTVIDWAIQLCSVLEYLHNQKPNPIIYGDMKPHNIILTKEGFIKLIDFGVSTIVTEATGEYTSDTAFIGTKGYAAPEQFIGNGISCASDIYSLGITLIQLITGIDPLKAISVFQNEKYAEYLSPGLFELLRKCIHPNLALRYQTVGILMKELRQYSLRSSLDNENNAGNHKKSINITKIIAITGSRGTGVSTMTAAMAEHMARGPTSVCIVDLSHTGRLEKSLAFSKEKSDSTKLIKIKSNLYYINLNKIIETIHSDDLPLHKQLGQLQDSFSYIFIDVDITLIKFIEQYLYHIFIVSDMNPFNLVGIGQLLKAEEIIISCIARTTFIINKYYKGELSSRNILQGMILEVDAPQQLQELLVYAKAFEVPYDQAVYIKWMYSFFGELLGFKNLTNNRFERSISNIVSSTISPKKRKNSRFAFAHLINREVWGNGQKNSN